jgi:arylsulfatase A-like enzyme
MPSRPNILLITTDQQHWNTLGSVNPRIQTPALDRLAAQGVRFDRAYCSNPVCSPSRSSIITGLYPSYHGCWTIGVMLPEDVPTVGDMLRAEGYATALIGKAHFQPLRAGPDSPSIEGYPTLHDLDFWREFKGPWYGFEHAEMARNHADESHAGQHYALWLEEKGLHNWRDYFQPWPPDPDAPPRKRYWMRDTIAWDLPEELHYNVWTAERTIAHMERCTADDQPFFIWSSFPDPHPPYLVPEPWASMYDPEEMDPGTLTQDELERLPAHFRLTREENPDISPYRETYGPHGMGSHLLDDWDLRRYMAAYYGMVSFVDQQIGRILDELERLGQAENTIILFTTDHGHFLGQHGLTDKGPYHFEDLLRIPMIVRYPGHVPAGQVSVALQSQVDFAPTFLAAAGIPILGSMQGVDQMPAWSGRIPAARDHVIVENRMEPTLMVLRTYIDERYKLTVYRDGDDGELFDLLADPDETHNLWYEPAHADLRMRLLHRMVQAEIRREPTRMARVAHA